MPANALLPHLKLPSKVRCLPLRGAAGAELWVKDDSELSSLYGGNKARKLQFILPHARARRARRLVTVGAAGSHHVLATALFGREAGFSVKAVLFPQLSTAHAVLNLKAGLAAGLEVEPVSSLAVAPLALAKILRPGDYLVPVGGSGPVGSQAFYKAAGELAGQIDEGQLPAPDVIVVALGSGGTAAGLLTGLAASDLDVVVCGVDVGLGKRASQLLVKGLATWLARRRHLADVGSNLAERLYVEPDYLGPGYGRPTREGGRATEIAASCDLALDPTYTAKAFAKALELGSFPGYDADTWPSRRARELPKGLERVLRASGRPLRVLYWHTLSRIVPSVPEGFELSPRLMKLFPQA